MKLILYQSNKNVLQGAFTFFNPFLIGVNSSVHIVGNTVPFDDTQANGIIGIPAEFYLVPTNFKDDFYNCLKKQKSLSQGTWKYDQSNLKDGEEEELKKFILSHIDGDENLTTDSIKFSEILEVNKVPVPPPPPPSQEKKMKFIFYKCQHKVLPGVLDFSEPVDNVFIVSNNVDFNYQKADSILDKQAEFYLIPTDFKDNYFLHCIERFENKNSSNKETWEDHKSNLKNGEEKKLKDLILAEIAGNDNPTIDSITFSEILEVKKITLPKSQEGGITLRDILAVLMVVFFVVALFFGFIEIRNQQMQASKSEMEKAEKAFVDGKHDQAINFARQVNKSYENTMNVAIDEVNIQCEPCKELRKKAINAFNATLLTTPTHNNVVLWTSKILKIAPNNPEEKKFVENMLKKVVGKYLEILQNPSQLTQKLDTPVLDKKLKDYANSNQRKQITLLLGP